MGALPETKSQGMLSHSPPGLKLHLSSKEIPKQAGRAGRRDKIGQVAWSRKPLSPYMAKSLLPCPELPEGQAEPTQGTKSEQAAWSRQAFHLIGIQIVPPCQKTLV